MTPMQPQGAPQKSNTNLVLIIVLAVGGLSLLCCVGTLAAIAVPNFLKFGARSKQAEAKYNLKAAFTAEKAWMAEHDTYSESIEEIGFAPERSNRYNYFFSKSVNPFLPGSPDGGQHPGVLIDARMGVGPAGTVYAAIPPVLISELGLRGKCPESCNITIVAAGNLDGDATMDLWSISTEDRVIDGTPVRAGLPYNHVDDTRN
jgi:type IV pilus assembly protein PilA